MQKIGLGLLLLLVGGVFAQTTSFIQSRFLDGDVNATCEDCTPNVDGVLEYKLAKPTIESKGESPSTATFTVQMRIIGGDAVTKDRTRLSFASARLAYSTAAFGESVVENGTCEYKVAEPFADLEDNYHYTFNDSTTDAFTLTASNTTETASNLLVGLTDEFQDFATIGCKITSAVQQAGIAISGTDITSNMIYVYNDLADADMGGERRIMLPLVHNSLRGWRLDGKTYAEDYALYSDGTGVHIKFSGPISSQLMNSDFVIEPSDSSITLDATHVANSTDAVVVFSGGVPTPGSILKFADPINDSALLAGNFIAALNHDENAPQATGISMLSREGNKSSWSMVFSHALDPSTVNKDKLCLSKEAGICSESLAAAVESLSYRNGATTVTVVIAETAPRTDNLSIVFERNIFRGVDQRVVEEDQVALRNGITTDDAGPVITVVALPQGNGKAIAENNTYTIDFKVTANESVLTLNSMSSYQLKSINKDTNALSDVSAVPIITVVRSDEEVDLRYTVAFSAITDLQNVGGFTLARGALATSLVDLNDNQPVKNDETTTPISTGDPIAPVTGGVVAPTAVALRDTTAPTLTVAGDVRPDDDNGNKYVVSFTVTSDEAIADIAEITSYKLTHKAVNDAAIIDDLTELIESSRTMPVTDGATVEYILTLRTLAETRATTGFALVRVADKLLDADDNLPQVSGTEIADDGELAMVARDSAVPKIDVTGQAPTLVNADNPSLGYEIVFTAKPVSPDTSETIRGFGEAASYTLLQVVVPGEAETAISGVTPMVEIDGSTATITYSGVNVDPLPYGFNLARSNDDNADECNLCDLSNNAPVDFADTAMTVGNAQALDSDAVAVIPDSMQPTITVRPTDGNTIATVDDNYTYSGSFTVTATEIVLNIAEAGSYQLLRIPSSGLAVVMDDATLAPTADTAQRATIGFSVMLGDANTALATVGFTLQRNPTGNLQDLSNNEAVIDITDTDARILIDKTAPAITVVATGIEPSNNGKTYGLSFDVSSNNDPVPSIGAGASYALLHIVGSGNPIALSPSVVSATANVANTTATVTFEVTIADYVDVRRTTGFTLVRVAGALRDRDGNHPVKGGTANNGAAIADGARIDDDATAEALRDDIPPQIEVRAIKEGRFGAVLHATLENTYVGSFTVRSVSGDDVGEPVIGLGAVENYVLLREAIGSGITTIQTATITSAKATATTNVTISFEVTFTGTPSEIENAIQATEGFTLGAGSLDMYDYSGNLPIGVSARGDRLDADDESLAVREKEGPIVTVVATGIEPSNNGKTYDLSFNVSSDISVPTIGAGASYLLLHLVDSGNPIDFSSLSASAMSNGDNTASTVTFTVTIADYTDVRRTTGFTLGRASGALTDDRGNNPLKESGRTIIDNARIDDADAAVALRDRDAPALMVAGDVTPDDDNGNKYEMSFTVTSDETIADIAEITSYKLTHKATNAADVIADLTTIIEDNAITPVTDGAKVDYTLTFSSLEQTRATTGFALVRVADKLLDASGNLPQIDGDDIADDGELAMVVRDSAAAKIDVTGQAPTLVNADNPSLGYEIVFTAQAVSPDTSETIRDFGEAASYTLLQLASADSTGTAVVGAPVPMVEIDGSTATITYSGVTVTPYGFNLGRSNDADAGECNLCDLSNNAPVDFADTAMTVGDGEALDSDAAVALPDLIGPTITVEAGMATADANDSYTMQFTVSANKDVATLGDAASYELRRVKNDNSLADDANANADSPTEVTATREYTIGYTADLSGLSKDEIRNTKGFTLVRAGTSSLIDSSDNPPARDSGSNDVIGDGERIDNDEDAIALRDDIPPQIEVRAIKEGRFGAVAINQNTYEGSFTVRSVSGNDDGEPVIGLGVVENYVLLREAIGGGISTQTATITSDKATATTSVTISFEVTFTGTDEEIVEAIQATEGFTLGAGSLNMYDYASNLPMGVDAVGDRLDADDESLAVREKEGPIVTVVATSIEPSNNGKTYDLSFNVSSDISVPTIGAGASYLLLHLVDSGNPNDFSSLSASAMANGDNTASTVTFTVTIADYADVRRTTGFTLGRASGALTDDRGNNPLKESGRTIIDNARIDDADAAVAFRDTTAPALTVAGDVTPDDDNGNKYEMSFTVTSDETIADITEITSYKLTHKATNADDVIADLTTIIEDNAITPVTDGAKVDYTLTFSSLEQTRATTGFALVRVADKLLDASGNLPQIDGDDIADDGELAMVARDSAAAKIDVTGQAPTLVNADNPSLGYEIVFTAQAVSPDTSETIRGFDEATSYTLLQLASANSTGTAVVGAPVPMVEIDGSTATITYSGVTVTPYGFNLGRSNDDAAGECNLCDLSNNAPVDFADTAMTVGDAQALDSDAAVALPDLIGPTITVEAGMATADASDSYTMQFTVSANKDVATLGDAASYELRRVKNDNSLADDANANADSPTEVTATREYTIGYTADLSGLDKAEIRNTKGFTLVRAGTSSLIDSLGNPPARDSGSNDVIGDGERIDNDEDAIALRDDIPPQIEVRAIKVNRFGAVEHATLENTYIGSFTVRSVSGNDDGEPVIGLGAAENYVLLREAIGSGITTIQTATITSAKATATTNVTISFEVTFTGEPLEIENAIQATEGFTLGAGSLNMYDYASNLPMGVDAVGDRLDADDESLAVREKEGPIVTVVATGIEPSNNGKTYDLSFNVSSDISVPTIGAGASYLLLHLVDEGAPIDFSSLSASAMSNGDNTASTVTFTVTIADYTDVRRTTGFTLGRASGALTDDRGNNPLKESGRTIIDNARIDPSADAEAKRDTDAPALMVAGDVTPDDDNGNKYVVSFTVTSDETVADIAEIGSYKLTHKAVNDAAIIDDLTGLIESSGTMSVTDGATVDYTLTFSSLEQTRATTGFALVRVADKLLDASGNLPQIDGDDIADDGELAMVARDSAVPKIDVTAQAPTLVNADNPSLGYEIVFTAQAVSPDTSETIRDFGEAASYTLLQLASADSTGTAVVGAPVPMVEIDGSTATITYSGVTVTPYGFNLGRSNDADAGECNLCDLSNNAPVDFADTAMTVGDAQALDSDAAVALPDLIGPTITVEAGMATADANDSYTMQFTVSANKDVATLGDAASYELRRVKNDNSLADDANANADSPTEVTATREYTIGYTADLSGLDKAEIRNTKGFTLVRAGTSSLIDSLGNPPARDSGSNDVIGDGERIDNDEDAIALRDDIPPQIEVRAIKEGRFSAVEHATLENTYIGSFTVRSVSGDDVGEPIIGLGVAENYVLLREAIGGGISTQTATITSAKATATTNVTISFEVTFTGEPLEIENAIQATEGFTLGAGSLDMYDYASNLPMGVDAVGDRLDADDESLAVREKEGPIVTVVATGIEPSNNGKTYDLSFNVSSDISVPTIGAGASYLLLHLVDSGNPIDFSSLSASAMSNGDNTASTVTFTVTIADYTDVRRTTGFTLGRASGALTDDRGNNPLKESGRTIIDNARIDPSADAEAKRDTDAPALMVAGDVTPDDDNGNKYEMSFTVTSDETIADIAEITSYKLTHKATNAADVIADLTTIIEDNAITPVTDGAKVDYTLTFSSLEQTRATTGFALVRVADKLLDASGNLPQIDGDDIADDGELAMVARDSAAAKIDVTGQAPTLVNADNPSLGYEIVFTAQAVSPDTSETIRDFGEAASYTLLQLASADSTGTAVVGAPVPMVEIDGSTATITYSGVTVTPYGFNLGRSNDAAAGECNLCDLSNNAPVDFADTAMTVGDAQALDSDAAVALPDLIGPTITVEAGMATADASDSYTMQFTVSANKDVATLGNAASYELRRVKKDNSLADDANANADSPTEVTAAREYTIGYTADLSGLDKAEIRNTKGFTLVRAGTSSLIDSLGNPPARDSGSNDVIGDGERIDNDEDAIALRDDIPPQIEVRAIKEGRFSAVEHATLENTYIGSFTVRSVSRDDVGEPIIGLGVAENYVLLREAIGGGISTQTATITSAKATATTNVTISFEVTFTGTDEEIVEAIQATEGFTLGAGSLNMYDYASNLPMGVDAVGDRLDADDESLAVREKEGPIVTVVATSIEPSNDGKTYDLSFGVNSDIPVPTIGAGTSYLLLHLVDEGAPIDFSSLSASAMSNGDNTASTVTFTVTIADYADVRRTTGFTLGRASGALTDDRGNNPLKESGRTIIDNARIDPSADAEAKRDTDAPALTVAGDVTPDDDNGNKYVVSFTVTSDETIADIAEIGSYKLTHEAVDDTAMIADLTELIESNATTPANNVATVEYTITFRTLAETRATTGFALVRVADKLLDASGNLPQIDGDDIADDGELAMVARDSAVPKIDVTGQAPTLVNADNPSLGYEIVFTAKPVSPDTSETIRGFDEATSYTLLQLASANSTGTAVVGASVPMVEIDGSTATITYSGVTVTPYGFNLGRSADDDAGECNLCDLSNNAPVDFADTAMTVGDAQALDSDAAVALPDLIGPTITVEAGMATADASDSYTMQFTVSANKDVATLGNAASYELRRVKKDNSLADDANANADSPTEVTATREYTIGYTADLSGLDKAEIRNTKGFTLVRAGTSSLIDSSGNPPARDSGSNDVIGDGERIDNDEDAIALRDDIPPQIEVRAIKEGRFSAVEHATLENTYIGSFTVRSVSGNDDGEPVIGLGAAENYVLLREAIGSGITTIQTATITSAKATATTSVTISFEVTFTGTPSEIENAIQATEGFTLGAGSLNMYDYASNLPMGVDAVGDRLDADDESLAVREKEGPIVTVVATGIEPSNNGKTYDLSFNVSSDISVPTIGAGASYLLLHLVDSGNPIDFSSLSASAMSNGDNTASTVTFTVTIADYTDVRRTTGFTLGRASGALTDDRGNNPLKESGRTIIDNARIDPSADAEAKRDTDAPALMVAGDVTPDDDNGNKYVVSFTVTSDETVADIAEIGSYKLTHKAVNDAAIIDDLTGLIESSGTMSVTDGATVEYTLTFSSLEQTRATTGFALVRVADKLLDASGNLPQIDGDDIADDGELAMVARDSAVPKIDVTGQAPTLVNADNPSLGYEIVFTAQAVSPDTSETIRDFGEAASYTLLQLASADSTGTAVVGAPVPMVEIDGSTATITYSGVTVTPYGFNLGRSNDADAGECNLCDLSNNAPVDFADTAMTVGDAQALDSDAAVALPDLIGPTITVEAGMATADANDSYTMQFTVSANKDVATLGNAASYELRRVKKDNSLADDANANADSPTEVTATREYTIGYTADLSGLDKAEIRNTKGFTLVRAGTSSLIDSLGNPPARDSGSNDVIGDGERIDNDEDAIALRDDIPPQIEVRAIKEGRFSAVEHATLENTYIGSFTVRSVSGDDVGEPVIGLGAAENYVLLREAIGSGITTIQTATITSAKATATTNVTISFEVTFTGTPSEIENAIQATEGFTLGAGSLNMYDYASNLPMGVDAVGDRLDADDESLAVREKEGPIVTVVATGIEPSNNGKTYDLSFNVSSDISVPTIGAGASYLLLHLVDSGNPIDFSSLSASAMSNGDNTASTVTFTVTIADYTDVRRTTGFTLGRASGALTDDRGNNPLKESGRTIIDNARIDPSADAEAKRDTDAPALMVAGDVTPDDDNGNKYEMSFTVTSDETVADIAEIGSYKLTHKAVNDAAIIDDLTGLIESSGTMSVTDGATVEYTLTLRTLAETRATTGFALVRVADKLLDASGNLPQIDGDDIADDGELAMVARDSAVPKIDVTGQAPTLVNADNPSLGYEIVFTAKPVSPDTSETIRGFGEATSYTLLQLASANPAGTAVVGVPVPMVEIDGSTATITYSGVTVTPYGFNLGRSNDADAGECNLCDLSNNAPVDFADTAMTVGDAQALDSDAAVALPDLIGPTITVRPTNATATVDDSYTYSGSFTVTATEDTLNIAEAGSYQLLRIPSSGPAVVMDDATLTPTTDTAQRATIGFSVMLGDANTALATVGFTLQRNPTGNLQDLSNNEAVIDITDTDARILIDKTAPAITVVATGIEPSNNGKTYGLSFDVSSNNDPVPSIGAGASYALLHIVGSGNPIALSPSVVSATANVANTTATVTFEVTIADYVDVRRTTGFTLVRVAGALRDRDGNHPVKGGTANNGAAIADGARIDDDATAEALRDDIPPQIEVRAIKEGRFGAVLHASEMNTYVGSFTVRSVSGDDVGEPVIGLGVVENYVLLREAIGGGTTILTTQTAAIATITSAKATATTNVTISFEVTFTGEPLEIENAIQATEGFTLGAGSLDMYDYSGNLPIGVSARGDRLDADDESLAVREKEGPIVTVVATGIEPSNNGKTYDLSFNVSSDISVPTIGADASYLLLHLVDSGNPIDFSSLSASAMSNGDNTASTVTFTVTIADYADVRRTTGFTLGRASGALTDDRGNNPLKESGRTIIDNARIDPSADAEAKRDTDAPALMVAGDVTPDDDNGNEYVVSFTVTSDETIADIAEIGSYKLTHKATNAADVIADLTTIIGVSVITPVSGGAKVDYILTFSSLEQTRATTGFALVRVADKLLDASGNLPQIDGDDIADDGELAMVARDSAAPKIDVTGQAPTLVNADNPSLGYEIVFTAQAVSPDTSETIRDFGEAASYTLLQLASADSTGTAVVGAPVPMVEIDGSTATITYSGVTVTPYGFNLGRSNDADAGECNLCDLSNNAPVDFADTAMTVGDAQALDSDAAVALPESNIATLSGLELTDSGNSIALSPIFASEQSTYTASVRYSASSIQVTPTASDNNASITVNTIAVSSSRSTDVALNTDKTQSTVITVVVTAEDGTTQSYTVTVSYLSVSSNATLTNLELTNIMFDFDGTTRTNVEVANSTTRTRVIATPASGATITDFEVNGADVDRTDAISLKVGVTKIEIEVTAEDELTTQSYIVNITRAAGIRIRAKVFLEGPLE